MIGWLVVVGLVCFGALVATELTPRQGQRVAPPAGGASMKGTANYRRLFGEPPVQGGIVQYWWTPGIGICQLEAARQELASQSGQVCACGRHLTVSELFADRCRGCGSAASAQIVRLPF